LLSGGAGRNAQGGEGGGGCLGAKAAGNFIFTFIMRMSCQA